MAGRNRSSPKRATNVSVRRALERALAVEITALKRKRWLEVNRDAIEAYNEYCGKHSVFSDEVRSF